jgi:hypothetical protein
VSSDLTGTIAQGVINLAMALYILHVGYRGPDERPGESLDGVAWHKKWGRTFRILGWVLLACFLFLLVQNLKRAPA